MYGQSVGSNMRLTTGCPYTLYQGHLEIYHLLPYKKCEQTLQYAICRGAGFQDFDISCNGHCSQTLGHESSSNIIKWQYKNWGRYSGRKAA